MFTQPPKQIAFETFECWVENQSRHNSKDYTRIVWVELGQMSHFYVADSETMALCLKSGVILRVKAKLEAFLSHMNNIGRPRHPQPQSTDPLPEVSEEEKQDIDAELKAQGIVDLVSEAQDPE